MLSWATSMAVRSVGRDGVEGGGHLARRDPQVVDGDAVELPGELPDGQIALDAHPVEDGPHRLRWTPVSALAADGRRRQQPAQIAVGAPQIQPGQHVRTGAAASSRRR